LHLRGAIIHSTKQTNPSRLRARSHLGHTTPQPLLTLPLLSRTGSLLCITGLRWRFGLLKRCTRILGISVSGKTHSRTLTLFISGYASPLDNHCKDWSLLLCTRQTSAGLVPVGTACLPQWTLEDFRWMNIPRHARLDGRLTWQPIL